MTINLDDLKSVWTDDGQTLPDRTSNDALVKQTKYRNRMTWMTLAMELLMLSGLIALLTYLIVTSDGWLASSLLGLCALVLIGVQIWMVRARNGLWRISAIEPIQHARFCVAQAELNLRFAKFSRIAAPAGLLAGYAAMSLYNGAFVTDLLRLGITAIAVAGWVLFCHYWIGRRQTELTTAQAIERELC